MDWRRLFHHLAMTPWRVRRLFPAASLADIEAAIAASETEHGGEIRFAVEGALSPLALWHGHSPRERAVEVFAQLRVWDTEGNSGVLIYVLLADRSVEIVADRGIHARVGEEHWQRTCRQMEAAFKEGKFAAGVLAGIDAVTAQLVAHFPSGGRHRQELPDRPVVL